MLEHLGLVSALTELSRKFADRSGLQIERRFADHLPPLSDEAELAVYRVAQESLTNVARLEDDLHPGRSEEHTSELQSPYDLVCRLLLEKKKKKKTKIKQK